MSKSVPNSLEVEIMHNDKEPYSHVIERGKWITAICGHQLNGYGRCIVEFGEPTCPACYQLVYGIPLAQTEDETP